MREGRPFGLLAVYKFIRGDVAERPSALGPGRKFQEVAMKHRFAGLAALLWVTAAFPPRQLAQNNKPLATTKAPSETSALSHDLSGVWMQFPGGNIPGTPGMDGINQNFRPPFTP
jgi:hypothetical protein